MTSLEEIFDTVKAIVTQDRNATHGNPLDQFQYTAELWAAYFGFHISREDVSTCMELHKISRRKHGSYNPDDYHDGLGYSAITALIASVDRTGKTDPALHHPVNLDRQRIPHGVVLPGSISEEAKAQIAELAGINPVDIPDV